MVAAWHPPWYSQLAARLPPVDWRQTLSPSPALVGAVLLPAVLFWFVGPLAKRFTWPRGSSNDQLAHFRALHDKGEISQEEFDRIRGLLGKRLRQQLEVPPAAPEGARPPEPPPAEPRPGQSE